MSRRRPWDIAFGVASLGAFGLFLWAGRNGWFFLDEWDFLGGREVGSASDLFRPHNEHWSTLPIIVYRALYSVVGLRTYLPYQTLVIALHIGAAWMLRMVMVRSGVVQPIAAAAALSFLLLGSGSQNIIWAFQIGFTGSLAAALGFLLLVDHDGPMARRDVAGFAVALAGLMSSGVSVPLTAGVGLAVLLRRGWRAAAMLLAPLAGIYLVWFGVTGRSGYGQTDNDLGPTVRFVFEGVWSALTGMGHWVPVAFALGGLLVLGAVLIGRDVVTRRVVRSDWAAPTGLAAGGFAFILISGWGRAAIFGVESAGASRYIHLLAATSLPLMAVAGSKLAASRGHVAIACAAAIFLLGVPGNVAEVREQDTPEERLLLGSQPLFEAMVSNELLAEIEPGTEVSTVIFGFMTVDFLDEVGREDKLEIDAEPSPRAQSLARTHLSFRQVTAAEVTDCHPLAASSAQLTKGDAVIARGGGVEFRLVDDAGKPGAFVLIDPVSNGAVATRDSITIELRTTSARPLDLSLCRQR